MITRRKLRSIEYLGAVCLIFTSDQNLGDFYWVNVNEPGAPFLVFINHTRLVDKNFYGGKNVYYIGAYLPPDGKLFSLPDDELAKLWFGYLPKLFPEFDARARRTNGTFSVSAPRSTSWTRITRRKFPITKRRCREFFWRTSRRFFPRTAARILPCARVKKSPR